MRLGRTHDCGEVVTHPLLFLYDHRGILIQFARQFPYAAVVHDVSQSVVTLALPCNRLGPCTCVVRLCLLCVLGRLGCIRSSSSCDLALLDGVGLLEL